MLVNGRGSRTISAFWSKFNKSKNMEMPYRRVFSFRPKRATPNDYLVYGIIGINVVVFLAWQEARQRMKRDHALFRTLSQNAIVNRKNVREGRIWTLITSSFSHMDTMHLFLNMYTFHGFGMQILYLLGNARFAAFYIGSGLMTGIASCWWQGEKSGGSLGASGCVSGLLTLSTCLFPKQSLLLFGVLPAPGYVLLPLLIGFDIHRAYTQTGRIDGAGHLGGTAFGFLYYLKYFRR